MGRTWSASSRLDCRMGAWRLSTTGGNGADAGPRWVGTSLFPAAVPVAVAGVPVLAPLQLAPCALSPYSGVAYLPRTGTYLSRTRQELCPGATDGPGSKRAVAPVEKGERHYAIGRTARH